jgi:23S rRNA pseudouridine2604 synthase
LTKIKLNKKSSETTNKSRAQVRRADPSKRDRSKAPTPKFKPESTQNNDAQNKGARQRNHRHDGSLREEPTVERAPTGGQPILRSEFKACFCR